MCEPHHSIIQFPGQDDDQNPTETRIDAIQPPDATDPGFWARLKKRIGNWFHFSSMGFGHSEAVGKLSGTAWNLLPADTKYEASWWDRKVRLDGHYHGPEFDKAPALEAATEYANRVSIGNLTTLRQFLEMSMRRSRRPAAYVDEFTQILNSKGKEEFRKYFCRLFGLDRFSQYLMEGEVKAQLDKAISICLGFTRKRGLLVPEWADDKKLWIPT